MIVTYQKYSFTPIPIEEFNQDNYIYVKNFCKGRRIPNNFLLPINESFGIEFFDKPDYSFKEKLKINSWVFSTTLWYLTIIMIIIGIFNFDSEAFFIIFGLYTLFIFFSIGPYFKAISHWETLKYNRQYFYDLKTMILGSENFISFKSRYIRYINSKAYNKSILGKVYTFINNF